MPAQISRSAFPNSPFALSPVWQGPTRRTHLRVDNKCQSQASQAINGVRVKTSFLAECVNKTGEQSTTPTFNYSESRIHRLVLSERFAFSSSTNERW